MCQKGQVSAVKKQTSKLALCSKQYLIYAHDSAMYILEWILLMRELNFGKLFFYFFRINKHIQKILK